MNEGLGLFEILDRKLEPVRAAVMAEAKQAAPMIPNFFMTVSSIRQWEQHWVLGVPKLLIHKEFFSQLMRYSRPKLALA
jgi:hypothetical protein